MFRGQLILTHVGTPDPTILPPLDLLLFSHHSQVRNWIMPINRKYNLRVLLETLREELRLKHKYTVLFEYVMLAGVNDRLDEQTLLSSN